MKPTSRRQSAAAVGVLVVGLAAVLISFRAPAPAAPRVEQMERVVPGLTEAEVVALLGAPPGDYCSDPGRFTVDHRSLPQVPIDLERGPHRTVFWRSDEARLEVRFGADGRVVYRRVCESVDQRPRARR
ncbi:hypothetical protein GobsT_12080 [Gemmata obscuriglobus]|uniref:Outer membrane protein assembly factor BamE n=1 Tax=Gemmata obscuriglobus TaxID=114 RepID=A0A2Z3H7F7_9BACT|nr:hypothetical protein [Gemmata obscuriglobus]AWM40322.1 hypothetical protein C1280_27170 [Gemmata obscuriglobus]QEG26468.1 hypothetical protein GobsT_12080 [Gemmata obscuriglobus]VTS01692.1 unnamed protein product [Gemmata obscuriglobus UQM 2246]